MYTYCCNSYTVYKEHGRMSCQKGRKEKGETRRSAFKDTIIAPQRQPKKKNWPKKKERKKLTNEP